MFGYPLASALPCLYGILVAACAKKLTGTAYWNMWDVMKHMLEQYPDNHGARFGIFLIAVAMSLSYLAGKWPPSPPMVAPGGVDDAHIIYCSQSCNQLTAIWL